MTLRRQRSRCCATTRLWRRWHLAALEHQRGLSWNMVAARFEALIG